MGKRLVVAGLIALLMLPIVGVKTCEAGPLSGAIFTTLVDGSRVNANIYEAKEAVYLDGGPGPNAPAGAAGLPEGIYVFQVTDPSGKVLLSTDPAGCRMFSVSADGVIVSVVPNNLSVKYRGSWVSQSCQHVTGIDMDYSELGAITVQLMPYANTSNNGGVYKVWATPVEQFIGDLGQVDCGYSPGNFHGFVPGWSKTDVFKVKGKITPPLIKVKKFRDSNANGLWDAEEPEISGWQVDCLDPLGVNNDFFTPADIPAAVTGLYEVCEASRPGWLQTAGYEVGMYYPAIWPPIINQCQEIIVAGISGEVHEVHFGNIELGQAVACKFYDRNANGHWEVGEPGVPGWKIVLAGTDVRGEAVNVLGITGEGGCVFFVNLLPGTYILKEIMPAVGSWQATTPTISDELALSEGGQIVAEFGNCCLGNVGFNTKGYWHNRHGLLELNGNDIAYVNALSPYASPSSYFGAGDEPFDGIFAEGTPVQAAKGDFGEVIAPAGSYQAEVSHFLVDANAGGDPCEQLSQQLLAFILNCRHRFGSVETAIKIDGQWVVADDIICQAVSAWQSVNAAEQNRIAGLLDQLNNSAVEFVWYNPCPVVY